MDKEIAVTILSNGRQRRLAKVIDRGYRILQLFPFSGKYFGDHQDQPIGVNKVSVHCPRGAVTEHMLHHKVLEPGKDDARIHQSRQHTLALQSDVSFAHLMTIRFTRLMEDRNDVKDGEGFIQIPEEFDPSRNLLVMSFFVSKRGTPFAIPADEPGVRILRIDFEAYDIVMLYTIFPYPSIDYSRFRITPTRDMAKLNNEHERSLYRNIMNGCTPKFATELHLTMSALVLIDYFKRRVLIAEQEHSEGLFYGAVLNVIREMAAAEIRVLEDILMERVRMGRPGVYLPDGVDLNLPGEIDLSMITAHRD